MTDVSKASAKLRLVLFLFLVLAAVGIHATPAAVGEFGEEVLTVTFFDVGQGDAIFIESPTGTQVLIDGGPDAGVLRDLSGSMGFFDRTIDMVLATHPDTDHVGGLSDVLERYEIAEIVVTENRGESTAAEAFFDFTDAEGARITYARRGMVYDLGGGAVLTILFPDRDPVMLESNTSSIVARLTYGEHEFLFTGDAPQSIEDHLTVLDASALESDVLKVGHHGSRTSTSELFVAAVEPEYAVISAEADNRYGHPHTEVLDTLMAAGAITKNTADEGSITFVSDGVTLEVR